MKRFVVPLLWALSIALVVVGCATSEVPAPGLLVGNWIGEVGVAGDDTVDYLSIDVWLTQTGDQLANDTGETSEVTVRVIEMTGGTTATTEASKSANTSFVDGSYDAPTVTLTMDLGDGDTVSFEGMLSGSSLTGTATATLPDGNGGEVVETFDITLNKQ
ncbi:MAG: hypothetical protein U5L04_11555 [Trueperaceae bacterium]|nr:hypothetical protein [Trueperaceae bacterium]